MADLSGLAAFGSSIYPGFVLGERNQAAMTREQEAAKQAKIQTQTLSDTIAGQLLWTKNIAALGAAYGVAPPDGAQPPPPATASIPASTDSQTQQPTQLLPPTSYGSPAAPPNSYMAPGPSQGQGQQGAQPTPPSQQASAAQPPPARPPTPPQQPLATGLPPATGWGQVAVPGGPKPPVQQPTQGRDGAAPAQQPDPQKMSAAAKQMMQAVEKRVGPALSGMEGQVSAAKLAHSIMQSNNITQDMVNKNPRLAMALLHAMEYGHKFLSADGKQ